MWIKAKGQHKVHREDINQLRINSALVDKIVCRWKGGDAFIFGR
ncbi:hypothetical protein BTN49_1479 [Candidatus Enterovibrio escicola]|uniref:Uncharacterized protein n=1 Tax=Candidatus Enterovibrio escicola TaxID=1927127 RepID=A0A2A5T449_9GAMM|nr:hypothetical protein BTN49_1479 [Candidatus Enterovibrio escacola]